MDPVIAILANIEVRSVVHFLQAGHSTTGIHRQLCCVYGDNIMTDGSVRDLCKKFKDGCIDVYDEGR